MTPPSRRSPVAGSWRSLTRRAPSLRARGQTSVADQPANEGAHQGRRGRETAQLRRDETNLGELITALFPRVAVVNGFAKKYVNEYFRLWKQAAEFAPAWVKCLGFEPGEPHMLGRALVRDLVLRLGYLESCERRLNKQGFCEAELAFLQHDSPPQVYRPLISEQMRLQKISQEKLAERLNVTTGLYDGSSGVITFHPSKRFSN